MHDAVHGVLHVATPEAIQQRWPRYGPALTALGPRAVTAAAIAPAGTPLGALMVLDHPASGTADELPLLADEVALSFLLAQESADPEGDLGGHPALVEATDWAVIQQAAGMVSQQQRCTIGDALDMLRARAYSADLPTRRVAEAVITRSTDLN